VIESRAGDAIDFKLIVELWPLAHHAGCLWRIHWDQAHCARDVGVSDPIGHDVRHLPIGQGVGMCPIGLVVII
jgi:hypothetical protein